MITHMSTLDAVPLTHFYPTEAMPYPHLQGWSTNSLQSIDAVVVLAKLLHTSSYTPTALPHPQSDD